MRKPQLGRGGGRLRIAYGRIFHEACAFSPLRTTREDFERMHRVEGDELAAVATLRGTELKSFFPHAELTGFCQAANVAGKVETVPLASSFAIPNGPLTRECFDWLVDDLAERLQQAQASGGALDGVYLALHGSMQVDDLDEAPEAAILRRVRDALGADAMIAASFDLHANLSPGIADALDVLVSYRRNPHWDLAPAGFRAGNRLIRALRGQCRPVHAWRKLPVVLGGGITIDFLAPMRGIYRYMRQLERDPRVLTANFFVVHPFTSADDLGWAVHITTDGDQALAERLADEFADRAWEVRRESLPPMHSIEEALDLASKSAWRKLGPVTLVDADDIVGAGAPGGNTRFVDALVKDDRKLRALVPVHDPELCAHVWDAAIGTELEVILRGTPGYDQPEVPLLAKVAAKSDSDLGRRVRLDVGTLHLAVAADPPLPIHPKYWRELGVNPRKADVMVQKNFFHYRIFHALTSFRHLAVVSQGATSLQRVAEEQYRVPCYPSADPADWRDGDQALRGLSHVVPAPEAPTATAATSS